MAYKKEDPLVVVPGRTSLEERSKSSEEKTRVSRPGDLDKIPGTVEEEEHRQQAQRTSQAAEIPGSTSQSLPSAGEGSLHPSKLFNAFLRLTRHAIDVIFPAVAVGFECRANHPLRKSQRGLEFEFGLQDWFHQQ